MHILAVSDKIEKLLYDYFDRDRWRDIDCIISCGDLNQKYLSFLVTMIPAPLLYVPGNHDVTYKKNPPEGCDPIDGRVIKIKNTVIAGLGGSIWYNGHDFQYTEKQMRQKVKKIIRQSKSLAG